MKTLTLNLTPHWCRYLDAFEDDGFEELDDVMHMTPEDIMDIKGMKKGHAGRISRALAKLLPHT